MTIKEKVIACLGKFPYTYLRLLQTYLCEEKEIVSDILLPAIIARKKQLAEHGVENFSESYWAQLKFLLKAYQAYCTEDAQIKINIQPLLEALQKIPPHMDPFYLQEMQAQSPLSQDENLAGKEHLLNHVRGLSLFFHSAPPGLSPPGSRNRLFPKLDAEEMSDDVSCQTIQTSIAIRRLTLKAFELMLRRAFVESIQTNSEPGYFSKSIRRSDADLYIEGGSVCEFRANFKEDKDFQQAMLLRLTQNVLMQKALLATGNLNMLGSTTFQAYVNTRYQRQLLVLTPDQFLYDSPTQYHYFGLSAGGIAVETKVYYMEPDDAMENAQNVYSLNFRFDILDVVRVGDHRDREGEDIFRSAPLISHEGEEYCYWVKLHPPVLRLQPIELTLPTIVECVPQGQQP